MQTDMLSIPGLETAHRLARLRPRDQRETAAIERLRSWDGRMGPDSVAATIYQAFTLRFAREVARAAIGDRDLAERWLDRADNGFIEARHLALALAVAPARALGRGRRGADRRAPGTSSRSTRCARALDELDRPLRRRSGGLGLGARARARVPARARRARTRCCARIFNRRLEVGGGQETVAQVGWDPNDPFHAIWAPRVADRRRPRRPRSARAGRRSPASRATSRARTTTTSSRAGRAARCSRWPARGRGELQLELARSGA